MRIVMVHNINRVAEIYARMLTGRGHDVTIYQPDLSGGALPTLRKLSHMPRRVIDLRHVVSQLTPRHCDVVHVHWATYGVLGLVSQVPMVLECHGADVAGDDDRSLFRGALPLVMRRARAVRYISPDLRAPVCQLRPDALFAPGPVETERWLPVQPGDDVSAHPWTVLLFTRLDTKKGVDVTTEGIARFAERHPAVRIRALRTGALADAYVNRYGKAWEFVPRIPAENLAALRRLVLEADVVVGQVRLGALGLSEFQAMCCAKPVVASFRFAGAYPDEPPICEATTPEEVADQLERLYADPAWAESLGQRGRRWVIEQHDHRTLATSLEALYQSLVNMVQ
jgi:glycosyltransferase involved in cell wall biosynthesis